CLLPSSPLFPYTTLFRSITVYFLHCENDAVFNPRPKRPRSFTSRSSLGSLEPGRIALINSSFVIPQPSSFNENVVSAPFQSKSIDRKSTRLNSSHVKISY